ncbi:MAG: HD-GYP domain-containing protein, partial [Planctomycetes bacterium]|nr:HD-GYP domain-containing protein [Planctomycetota bacterium]
PVFARHLSQYFDVQFAFVDGETGELLDPGVGQPSSGWEWRGQACREVLRRAAPEFIDEAGPLVTLAIPLAFGTLKLVAISVFLSRAPSAAEWSGLSEMLDCDCEQARRWADARRPVDPELLLRLSQLAVSRLQADARIRQLEGELESLSQQIGNTYEEITLLHRLTTNLRISSSHTELGRMALQWLAAAVPAQGLAMLLHSVDSDSDPLGAERDAAPVLLTHGDCPVDTERFLQLLKYLQIRPTDGPRVMNTSVTGAADWPCPGIRELVVAPLAEGEHELGWIAAINHDSGKEFGSIEATLLSSVAAILGIHSGNLDLYRQQADLLAGIVRALSSAIDAKEPCTCGQSDRVARVAVRLARELGCPPEVLKVVYLSGLLHDIGKIGVDDRILRKPDKLTSEEFEHIKTHTLIGHRILIDLKQLGQVLPVVLHHHESWDGSGYPDRLAGEQIPLLARIVAVADSFDAMASDRPYRKGMPDEKLDGIIRSGAGTQWDPRVVDAFFSARADLRAIAQRNEPLARLDFRQFGEDGI